VRTRYLLAGVISATTLIGLAATQAVTAQTVTAPRVTAPACGPTWSVTATAPDAKGQTSDLLSVARAADGTVWAVGEAQAGASALIEQQTPSGWVRVPSHAPASSVLASVAADSAGDVWAVGTIGTQKAPVSTLIERWNGTSWAVVKSPDVKGGFLDGVTVLSPDDAWAVGTRATRTISQATLTEHWNGTAWTVVPSPTNPRYIQNQFTAVAALSAHSVWAVGEVAPGAVAAYWDGTDWRIVGMADPQNMTVGSLAVISPSNIWSVGRGLTTGLTGEHWNGRTWQLFTMAPTQYSANPNAVAADGARDVWVAGGPTVVWNAVFENYNGGIWRTAVTPELPDPSDANAVTTLPGGGALAVGLLNQAGVSDSIIPQGEAWEVCPVQFTGTSFSPAAATDPDWLTTYWRSAGHAALALRDASGLGLFRSAPLAPGATYSYRYYASGTYPVAAGSARGEVSVPVHVLPAATGQTGTRFLLTWAARVAPYGYVYDVQEKAPGQASFEPFRSNVSYIDAKFTPAQAGIYQFEARLRRSATGAHSGWSPPLSVTVTGSGSGT
jgi:hypothetical protein